MDLVKWDKIKAEIARCRDITVMSKLSYSLDAIQKWAKQSNESLETQNEIAEYRLRLNRKRGQWIEENIPQKGGNPQLAKNGQLEITLSQAGIGHHESPKLRAIASIPEKIFENHIKEIKESKEELTSREFTKLAGKINQKLEREKLKERALPEAKYQVIYADPPWEYRNSGFPMSAEKKYPTMSTDKIASLNVKEISDEDSILFLWVTNPILEDAFKVIGMWGFEYKTNMVWIKSVHTAGFYVFGQHELLLIATRGSMTAIEKKPKSIIYGKNTVHSRKPESVYEIIEGMYPNLNYIELFARKTRDGWSSWGNEIPEDCTDKNKEIS